MSRASEALITFTAMTLNVWGGQHGDQRRDALHRLFSARPPDLLATQELRGWSRATADDALVAHARVIDEFGGWEHQSNLWWATELFDEIEHGADDVGILDRDARLFWVRLRVRGHARRSLLFATAHLTWPGHQVEQTTGVNLRLDQARRIVARLDELDGGGDVILTTDVNDIGGPLWVFGNSGFLDSFSALGRHSPPTHPVTPNPFADGVGTSRSPLASPSKAIDWIFVRGALQVRASEVVEFFHRGIAPSDHAPVVATLTLRGDRAAVHHQPQSTSEEEPT